jgi:hypothetical protein
MSGVSLLLYRGLLWMRKKMCEFKVLKLVCACHGGVWGNERIVTFIIKFGNIWM